jgi:uncharacterized BrkB/YihY/UPF0761 family membrane protein
VLAPVCIALLMVVWGTLVTQSRDRHPALAIPWRSWMAGWLGIVLALYVFMADALRVVGQGPDAVRHVLPASFDWPLFCAAVALMCVPIAHAGWRMSCPRSPNRVNPDSRDLRLRGTEGA